LKAIIYFSILTGARRSEVLHAEWTDFDWENGVWEIRIKPDCPTQYGLGWSPKWGKERDVILCTPAIELLQSLDRVKSTGKVNIRNESLQVVDQKFYPANFVFPKKEIQRLDDGKVITRFTRSDSFRTAWESLLKRARLKDIKFKDLRTYFNHC
jgi:integrase